MAEITKDEELILKWRLEQMRLGKKIGLRQGDLIEHTGDDKYGYPKKGYPLVVDTFTEIGGKVWVNVVYLGMPLMVHPDFRDARSQHLPIYTNWNLYKKKKKAAK
jgi:hypothetical protein